MYGWLNICDLTAGNKWKLVFWRRFRFLTRTRPQNLIYALSDKLHPRLINSPKRNSKSISLNTASHAYKVMSIYEHLIQRKS